MFSLVDSPTALPGSCYLCGSGEKSPFIDWGVSIEFYGALYTCSECTASVASLLGMVSMNKHTRTVQLLDQLQAQNLDLIRQVMSLSASIESLTKAGFSGPVHSADDLLSSASPDPELSVLADDKAVDEAPRETNEFLDFGAGTTDEPRHDKGMDELRPAKSKSDRRPSI